VSRDGGCVPPQQSDRQLLEFLHSAARPLVVVATKSDRLSGNQLRNALRTLEQEYPGTRILPYSAKTGAGLEAVWAEIKGALESSRKAAQL
jgi:GTP-binding protein